MLKHFPKVPEDLELVNAADKDGVRRWVIERLVAQNIEADYLLVEINRHLGGHFPKNEAIDFIVQHGEHGAKIANREFTGFVYVFSNGVAGGFRAIPASGGTENEP